MHDGRCHGERWQAAGDTAEVPGLASQVAGAAAQEDARTGPGRAAWPRSRVLADTPGGSAGQHAPAYGRHDPPPTGMPGTAAQQAFIGLVAPGAIAAQQRYGIPASVTIAQAIDESGWGQSELATADHNLFGIKGTGPAGSDMRPTQEYENGIWVTRTAPFRVYHNIAESIADHGRLLATSQAYQHAMANRQVPDAFAAALTGVYATDPELRLQPDRADAAVQPVPLRLSDAGRRPAPGAAGGGGGGGAAQAAVPGVPASGDPAPGAPAGGGAFPGWRALWPPGR